MIHKAFGKNIIWVANQLSTNANELTIKEVQGLTQIFYEFIESFLHLVSDESSLVELVKGL